MNRLQAELHRLYLPPPEAAPSALRAMVFELARPAHWESLAKVWRGVQADLDLPAPAIAVSDIDGYQLWFSLAVPVPAAQALGWLEALRRRYLGELAAERIAMRPADAVPPLQAAPGHWSAFVAPDLAALFADEPWLDLPPGDDAQAELLSRLVSIQPDAFRRALERLAPVAGPVAAPVAAPLAAVQSTPAGAGTDPRRFLLGIMNDATVDLSLRIEAAKALLPYGEGQP